MTRSTATKEPVSRELRRRTMTTPVGPLVLVAGPRGLRAVLWPGEDGSRVARSVGPREDNVDAQTGTPGATPSEVGAGKEDGEVRAAKADGAAGVPTGSGSADDDPPEPAQAETHLDRAELQLGEYFAGTRRTFDLALDPAGTDFQLRAWRVLGTIPYGRTISYGEQAAELGEPGAARAVGAANGRNPLSIVVPCHRVVSASGALTGFAGGLDIKAWLLEHERAALADR